MPDPPDCYIRVTTQAEGLHHWPVAPAAETYLRHPHRHLFTVTVRMQTRHSDREIEINSLARWLGRDILPSLAATAGPGQPLDFGSQSCEHLATAITDAIRTRYGPARWIECEVLEDGILGGGTRSPAQPSSRYT
jgi:hypothetical protein